MLYSEKDCTGDSWDITLYDQETEYNMDIWELMYDTSIGDNSLSSVAVPEGYELLIWQHDGYGESRIYAGLEWNSMECQNIDGSMDNEASNVTFRKSAPGGPGGPGGPEATPVEEDLPISIMPVEEEDLPVSTMPVYD